MKKLEDLTIAELKMLESKLKIFHMYKGNICERGFDQKLFERFDLCISGHFHHRSHNGNITYVGSPYEIISADRDDPRGFHIFDTETREIEFIRNPFTMFVSYVYDDVMYDMEGADLSWAENKSIKLNVIRKTDQKKYDRFLDRLKKQNPVDLKINEDYSEYSSENVEDEDIDITDTFTLLSTYIDSVDTDLDRDRIKEYMSQLYLDALQQVAE